MRSIRLTPRLALALGLASLGRATAADAAAYTVLQAAGRQFAPAALTVAAGDTVTWRNADTMPHTTTSGPEGSPDGRFDSGNMDPGATFSYTFAAPGTYPYHCDYHSGMVGQVTVVASAALVRLPAGRVFQPASVTIAVGEAVIWRNDDTMPHTATSGPEGSPDGLFDSGNLDPGATFAHVFTSAGTFPYHCDYHSGMVGQVVVVDRATVVRQVAGRRFEPQDVAVQVGDTVIWRNDDAMPHTTTSGPEGSPDGRFDSGNMDPGASFAHLFSAAGAYPYYCDYHSGMIGSVQVNGAVTGVLLRLQSMGPDVVLDWTGGVAPWDVLRGQDRRLSDLAPWRTVAGPQPTTTDAGAVTAPPALVLYQVQ